MSVLRIRALEVLAECIAEEVPELAGHICAGPAEPNHKLEFPSLAIIPVRYFYQPEQAKEWRCPTHSDLVIEVGKHEARVVLRLGAATHRERVIIEQKVLDVFLSQPLRPGVIVNQVADCFDAVVAWELEDEEWEDERAFDQKWYSDINVLGQIPALVCRPGSYTIEQLQLGVTDDFGTVFNQNTFNTSADVEVVEINQDGSIAAV